MEERQVRRGVPACLRERKRRSCQPSLATSSSTTHVVHTARLIGARPMPCTRIAATRAGSLKTAGPHLTERDSLFKIARPLLSRPGSGIWKSRKVRSLIHLLTPADSLYVEGVDRTRPLAAPRYWNAWTQVRVERRSSSERFGGLRMKGFAPMYSLYEGTLVSHNCFLLGTVMVHRPLQPEGRSMLRFSSCRLVCR